MKRFLAAALAVLAVVLASPPALATPRALAQDTTKTVEDLREEAEGLAVSGLRVKTKQWHGYIQTRLDTIKAKGEELAAAAEDDKAEIQKAIDAAEAEIEAAGPKMNVFLKALAKAGEDVAEERTFLIEATGDITYGSAADVIGLTGRWLEQGKTWLVDNGPGLAIKAVVFVLLLLVAKLVAGLCGGIVRRSLSGKRVKASDLLKTFAEATTRKVVFFIGALFALASVGVSVGPFLAAFGAVGLVVGFALSETLNNFAAGIMVLLYRPYDVGDYVTAGGEAGTVLAMTLVSTTLKTPDNQSKIVPNGSIWGGVITNVTANPTRRVDLTIGISYGDNIDDARRVILETVKAHDRVLDDPEPIAKVHNLGDSSVDFVVRPWCKTKDYWDVYWDLTEGIKKALDEAGISIPFPQRDVHMIPVAPPAAQEATGAAVENVPVGSIAANDERED